jgi:hypothetical protein
MYDLPAANPTRKRGAGGPAEQGGLLAGEGDEHAREAAERHADHLQEVHLGRAMKLLVTATLVAAKQP